MSEELKCNSNSDSRGSNRRQGQLEALRITMKAIRAITSSFRDCLRGDNSRMDSLVDNVNFILDKQSCFNSALLGGNDASEPMVISGSSPSVDAELESLKAGLLSIQLQVNAYRGLADDHGSLNLLLQNLDALIGKHSHMFSPSVRINNNIRLPIRPIPSASAKVEIIDLEPDLPDSTFETFGIQTGSDAATAGADVIIDHNLNPTSSSTGDPKHVEDVELPPCSSFVSPSIPQNRKRKTNSKGTGDSRANMAFKTAKVVTKPGRSSSSTRSSLRNSREDHHIGIEIDVTAENPNFIHNNNVNLDRVKIETDYDPPGRNQKLIKLENSDDVASADSHVKMSYKSSIENYQQSAESSPVPDVNNGLGETVQAQDLALNLTDEATPIQQNGSHIFEQNKIWTAIFKNLDLKDQKNVRFVNKKWKQMADARLIHEKRWKLIIDNKFRKRYRGKTLDDLSDCIANSDGGFPLTTLIFGYLDSQCNDYTKPSLLRLYNLHGSKITSLVLRDFRASAAALHDLLLNRLPNIENIYIYQIWLTKNEKLFTSTNINGQELITLPNLKTIRFNLTIDPRNKAHQAIFKAFLASAVNLKEVENVHSHMLPCIAQAGKLNCVKNFKFFPRIFIKAYTKVSWPKKKMSAFEQPTDRASFEKLCEFQPKLTTLKINVQTFKSRELVPLYIVGLNKILQSSKDTLTRLQIPSFFFVPGLVIPNLKNLYRLEVYHCFSVKNLDPPAIFPGNLNLSEVFPNVRVLSCFLVGIANESDWISKYFPLGNNKNNDEGESSSSSAFEMSRSFPSVTRLEFEHHYCFGKALELYFPMLTDIICYEFDLSYRNGVHVGANCGLRETTIGIESLELRGFRFNGEKSRLDELFTGIPRSECLRLNDGDSHSTEQAGNHLFQNLKNLRRLEIVFDHMDNTKLKPSLSGCDSLYDEPTAIAVMTPFSYRHAFALMKNLKQVFFAYNHDLPASPDFAKIIQPCCTEFRPPAAH